MAKYEALKVRVEGYVSSTEGKAAIRKGHAFGKKVKAARIEAAPALAAERETGAEGVTVESLADAYGMSRGSVTNYTMLGILMLADDSVDSGKAYTFVTKNDGAPNLAEVRQAADERLTEGKGDVLAILTAIVDERIAADQTPGDPNLSDEGDEVEGDEVEDKTATYYAQATDALANILNKGNAASLTLDEAGTLAAQVAEITRLIRAAQPKAA